MKKLILLLLILSTSTGVFAQSRTEEAKKRLDGESRGSNSAFIETLIEVSLEYLPEFFYFRRLGPDEPVMGYSPYPYHPGYGRGIRSFTDVEPKPRLFHVNLNLSMPQGSLAMEQYAGGAKWNLRYWALQSRYEYLKEAAAPYGIHQFDAAVERKFRFFYSGDAGLFLGVRRLSLSGDTYWGPEAGSNFEIYPFDPVSIKFTTSAMWQEYGTVTNQELSIGIHRDMLKFSVGYRWLNVHGVPFRTLSAGFGIYL